MEAAYPDLCNLVRSGSVSLHRDTVFRKTVVTIKMTVNSEWLEGRMKELYALGPYVEISRHQECYVERVFSSYRLKLFSDTVTIEITLTEDRLNQIDLIKSLLVKRGKE